MSCGGTGFVVPGQHQDCEFIFILFVVDIVGCWGSRNRIVVSESDKNRRTGDFKEQIDPVAISAATAKAAGQFQKTRHFPQCTHAQESSGNTLPSAQGPKTGCVRDLCAGPPEQTLLSTPPPYILQVTKIFETRGFSSSGFLTYYGRLVNYCKGIFGSENLTKESLSRAQILSAQLRPPSISLTQ